MRTPLLPAEWARNANDSANGALWLKPENLQPIGAFKLRGAYYAVARLTPEQRAAGVITHSSGNHAQALAYTARAYGIPCTVVMPADAAPVKIVATRTLGAHIVLVPPEQRLARTQQLAAEQHLAVIPPFDHLNVIAGQGTIGLEIVHDMPEVDVVLVPVGGGGVAAGVATVIKALRPGTAVIGVEPELAGDAAESFHTGTLHTWPIELRHRTITDGLRANVSELTLAHLLAHLDDLVTVSEDDIVAAMGTLASASRLVAEPSGAVAVAAYLYHRDKLPPGRTVAVITGGNVDPKLLISALQSGTAPL